MRYLILLIILLAIDWYAFQAFRTIVQQWSASARLAVAIAFWSAPALAVVLWWLAVSTSFPQTNKAFFTILSTLVVITYLSKLTILPVLLLDDARRLMVWLTGQFYSVDQVDTSRSRFLSQLGMLLAGLPFVTLTYGIIRNPYRYTVFREKIRLAGLPEALHGLRIVQISDIHAGSFTFKEPVKNAIELINAADPDLVFFTGDLVNDRSNEMDNFMDVFSGIRAHYGVFSVLGNHDYGDYVRWESSEAKQADFERMKQIHQQLGWQLLLNEHRTVDINGAPVVVIGVENHSALNRFPRRGDLRAATNGIRPDVLQLLLSHDPTHWDMEVNTAFPNIAVTFSGHTHGFQFGVEIPGFKWSPAQFIYKQWAGLYQKGKQYLYVNRGLGFIGYPGRVGILPEIAVIELEKA